MIPEEILNNHLCKSSKSIFLEWKEKDLSWGRIGQHITVIESEQHKKLLDQFHQNKYKNL